MNWMGGERTRAVRSQPMLQMKRSFDRIRKQQQVAESQDDSKRGFVDSELSAWLNPAGKANALRRDRIHKEISARHTGGGYARSRQNAEKHGGTRSRRAERSARTNERQEDAHDQCDILELEDALEERSKKKHLADRVMEPREQRDDDNRHLQTLRHKRVSPAKEKSCSGTVGRARGDTHHVQDYTMCSDSSPTVSHGLAPTKKRRRTEKCVVGVLEKTCKRTSATKKSAVGRQADNVHTKATRQVGQVGISASQSVREAPLSIEEQWCSVVANCLTGNEKEAFLASRNEAKASRKEVNACKRVAPNGASHQKLASCRRTSKSLTPSPSRTFGVRVDMFSESANENVDISRGLPADGHSQADEHPAGPTQAFCTPGGAHLSLPSSPRSPSGQTQSDDSALASLNPGNLVSSDLTASSAPCHAAQLPHAEDVAEGHLLAETSSVEGQPLATARLGVLSSGLSRSGKTLSWKERRRLCSAFLRG